MLARVGKAMAEPAERIAAQVRASEVIASDETGLPISRDCSVMAASQRRREAV